MKQELSQNLLDQFNSQNDTTPPSPTEEYNYKLKESDYDIIQNALKLYKSYKVLEEHSEVDKEIRYTFTTLTKILHTILEDVKSGHNILHSYCSECKEELPIPHLISPRRTERDLNLRQKKTFGKYLDHHLLCPRCVPECVTPIPNAMLMILGIEEEE